MWIFVLCSLALVLGASAKADCSKDAFDQCESPAIFTFIPSDVLEFNSLCPQPTAFLRCLKEFQDDCGGDEYHIFFSEEEYDGIYGTFRDLCEEGTFLNRVATENLKCLNETFRTTSCPEKAKAVTGPYRSPVHGSTNENSYMLPIETRCLQDILESNCIAADIGENCGKDALEATVEFIRRIYYIEDTCGKYTAMELLKGLDAYNLNPEQKALAIANLEQVINSSKE